MQITTPEKNILQKKPWRIKISLTDKCNFRCYYCKYINSVDAKPTEHEFIPTLNPDLVIDTLKSAYHNGIRTVHWSGGEPTLCDLNYFSRIAKDIGYSEQSITSNGFRLYKMLGDLVENGLTSANISLDTLDPDTFKDLTGSIHHSKVVDSIKRCCEYGIKTKLNVVVMNSNFAEIRDFIEFCEPYSHTLSLKFLELWEFSPKSKFDDAYVSGDKIITSLQEIGDLVPTKSLSSNPNVSYFRVGNYMIPIGVVNLPPDSWRCGGSRCKKVRVYADGTTCEGVHLKGLSCNGTESAIKNIMIKRMSS